MHVLVERDFRETSELLASCMHMVRHTVECLPGESDLDHLDERSRESTCLCVCVAVAATGSLLGLCRFCMVSNGYRPPTLIERQQDAEAPPPATLDVGKGKHITLHQSTGRCRHRLHALAAAEVLCGWMRNNAHVFRGANVLELDVGLARAVFSQRGWVLAASCSPMAALRSWSSWRRMWLRMLSALAVLA